MHLSGRPPPVADSASAELKKIYVEWADFVWLTLQRLGVRRQDLDDVCHDVFIIAYRKLPEFDRTRKVNAWLFGICVRVAANYRRRAHIRLERAGLAISSDDENIAVAPEWARPDREADRRQVMERATLALARMSPVKRVVLVMFEVEGLSCQDIATQLGLPVGTVYSRLHAARKLLLGEVGDVAPRAKASGHE
jgi:RNA polymerase sigma-70 factor (ECF subfamily)